MLDPKRVPTFEKLLDFLSEEMEPKFGPILRLARAEDHAFVHGYDGFEEGAHLVAVGRGNLKKLDYMAIPSYQARSLSQAPMEYRRSVKFDASNIQPRVQQAPAKATVVQVLPTGDEDGIPLRVVVPPHDLQDWVRVLEHMTDRCRGKMVGDVRKVSCGGCVARSMPCVCVLAVRSRLCGCSPKVYTLAGDEVLAGTSLTEDQVYVVLHAPPLKLPPFDLVNGHLVRKVVPKTKPVLPKIEAKPRGPRKVVAAFGRTGAGIMADKVLPNPDFSNPTARRNSKGGLAAPDGTLPAVASPESAWADGPQQSWYMVQTPDEAVNAVDQLIAQVHAWPEATTDDKDDAMMLMQRRLRDRLFELRKQSPDVTTAFDSRIEEVLNFMMQAPGTEHDDRSPAAIESRCGSVVVLLLLLMLWFSLGGGGDEPAPAATVSNRCALC